MAASRRSSTLEKWPCRRSTALRVSAVKARAKFCGLMARIPPRMHCLHRTSLNALPAALRSPSSLPQSARRPNGVRSAPGSGRDWQPSWSWTVRYPARSSNPTKGAVVGEVLEPLRQDCVPGTQFESSQVHHALFRTARFPGDGQEARNWRALGPASRSQRRPFLA